MGLAGPDGHYPGKTLAVTHHRKLTVTIAEYLESVKALLFAAPIITSFQIVRERQTLVDAHLRVRLALSDGSLLEFSEYVQHLPENAIAVVTYSYHWADSKGSLRRRWDNTPHFPNLPGFPHHIHEGEATTILPGMATNIFVILEQIEQQLGNPPSTQK